MATDRAARLPRTFDEAEALSAREPRGEASILSVAPPSEASHQRQHSRFSVDLDVSIASDHNFYAGFAENLSAGGMFIATHKLKPVGSRIELGINLPSGTRLEARGEVRWIRVFNEHSDTPPGMGVKFDPLPAESIAAIEDFLAQRAPLFFDDD